MPALCISCIWEVLWVAWAEPRRHSTCSPHWVQGSCCLPLTPLFCQVPLLCLELVLFTAHWCDTWSLQATKSNIRGHEAGEGLQCYRLAEGISDGDTSLSEIPLPNPQICSLFSWQVAHCIIQRELSSQLGKNNAVLEYEVYDSC